MKKRFISRAICGLTLAVFLTACASPSSNRKEEGKTQEGHGSTQGGEAAKTGGTKGRKLGYIGCYKDTSAYDLDGFLERSRNNTPQRCTETCRAKGFAYAGVQYGESCLCGNSYGKYGPADNCDYKCTGDPGQICGGYSANSVYGTGAGGD